MHCTKISPEFVCEGQTSKVKVTRDKKRKTAETSPLTVHSKACASAPYATCSSRRYHCIPAGGDMVTAVHADGGLPERSSGALRPVHQENQHMLTSCPLKIFHFAVRDIPRNSGHKRPQHVMAPFLLNCPRANSM